METLANAAGEKIDGDAFSEEYQREFIDWCEIYLTNTAEYQSAQRIGGRWVEENYQYADIVQEWESHWDDFFARRLRNNVGRIARNLIHHDDFRAAIQLANRFGLNDVVAEINDYLSVLDTPDAYASCAIPPDVEVQSSRFDAVLTLIEPKMRALSLRDSLSCPRILDFACGNGAMTVRLKQAFPTAQVIGIDFSETLCRGATEFASKYGAKIEFRVGTDCAIRDYEKFDLIFCGEYLEHNWDYHEILETLESHLTPDGWLVWTVPTGAMVEYLIEPKMRAHRIHWETNTVQEVFGNKPGFATAFIFGGITPRGNRTGHYIIKHQKGMPKSIDSDGTIHHQDFGEIDWDKKIALTRPYESVDVCMITKNESKHLRKCLESVFRVADDIFVADLDSTDDTCMIAKSFDAHIIHLPERWPESPRWAPNPGSFEWARNESIAQTTADWLLWIDADEELIDAHLMRQYLHTRVYEGYIVRQNHLALDAPVRHDKPIRLLRNGRGYRFYGHIHEHCQSGLNDPRRSASDETYSFWR